jgi:hypothetical protein
MTMKKPSLVNLCVQTLPWILFMDKVKIMKKVDESHVEWIGQDKVHKVGTSL